MCSLTAILSSYALGLIIGSNTVITVLSILFAVVIYVIMLALLRAIERDDVISLPKGKKIEKILEKFKIIR